MIQLYNILKTSYNLGDQYIQDCYALIESGDGFELMFQDNVNSGGQITKPTLTNEDYFKKLDPQNKAFRKYQHLRSTSLGLEAIAFGLGMRKDKKNLNIYQTNFLFIYLNTLIKNFTLTSFFIITQIIII